MDVNVTVTLEFGQTILNALKPFLSHQQSNAETVIPTEEKKEPSDKKVKEVKEKKPAEVAVEKTEKVTLEKLRALGTNLLQGGAEKVAALKVVLAELGVKKLTDIEPSQYDEAYAQLLEL